MTRQEELQDQLEDTVFALLMNEIMQREGQQIWTEYQKEKEKGSCPPVPKDTDRRMTAFIRKQFREKNDCTGAKPSFVSCGILRWRLVCC